MGEKSRSPHPVVRFACFELDQEAGELRKEGGKCIRLQEQPLQILRILLERPGEIITRDELRHKIWPADTFVDFDHGINNAIKRLREALGDTAETPRYIETLPRRGYRFVGQPKVEIPAPTNRIQSLAVLPLENLSRDPDQEFFADGMTEALITNLAKISALHVVSRTSAMYYKGVHRPLREIARELQVDGIVEGTVMRSGQRVRISAQLVDARTDAHLWAEIYDRDLRDVLELQSEVARTIASEVQVKVSPLEQTQLTRTRSVDPEAYEAYLKGRHYWNMRTGEGMKQGLVCFQKAIEIDPTYAAARGLGRFGRGSGTVELRHRGTELRESQGSGEASFVHRPYARRSSRQSRVQSDALRLRLRRCGKVAPESGRNRPAICHRCAVVRNPALLHRSLRRRVDGTEARNTARPALPHIRMDLRTLPLLCRQVRRRNRRR